MTSTDSGLTSSLPWRDYGFAVGIAATTTALAFAIYPFFELTNLVMLYLLGTLAVATRGHRGPAALSSLLSVLCFDFFFVPPRFSFRVSDAQYIVTFAVMFTAAMIISHLTVRLRLKAEAARQGQLRTVMMHELTQQLTTARGADEILSAAACHIEEIFNSLVTAFVPNQAGNLVVKKSPEESGGLSEKARSVAQWVYESGQPAGLGTQALSVADALYVPLQGAGEPVGVLRIQPRLPERILASDQRLLLNSFAHQIGLALEVDRLRENAKKTELEIEAERLRSSLLSSVSHDFRTPLAAIVGSAGALLEKENLRDNHSVRELLENIQTEGERLSRLVQNLLEATRLESGAVRIRKELYPFEEVIGSALDRLGKLLTQRKVDVILPEDLPLVPVDGVLIEQVLINLLENAVRHTPPESRIEVSVRAEAGNVLVSVADEGPGLTEEEIGRVFDKFYHGRSSPGAGLGLAICRAIVLAHEGRIWAENRLGRGAVFCLTLPLGKQSE